MRREFLFGLAVAVVCAGLITLGLWIFLSAPREAARPPGAPGPPAEEAPPSPAGKRSGGEHASEASRAPGGEIAESPVADARATRTGLPTPTGDIFGRITGPNGKPPEGLRVWIVPIDGLDAETLRDVWANKRAVAYFVEHRTEADRDESGAFAVADVEPGSYLVVAWAPGLARAHAVIEHEIEPTRCDIEMETGQVLTGSVLNSAGDPIPGATVEAQFDYHTGIAMNYGEPVGEIFAAMSCREVGRADARGRFRLDTLPKGQYIIWGSARDYSEEGLARIHIPPTKEVTIRLFEGGAVEGIVRTPAGEPIPDVLLWCGLFDRPEAVLPVSWSRSDGTFRFDHVPVGPVTILTAKPPYAARRVDPGYLERGTTLHAVVELEEGAHIRGKALDVDDHGVPGLHVAAITDDRRIFVRVVRTDESGAFDLVGVPRDIDQFYVYTWGAQKKGFLDSEAYAGPGEREVILRLRPYGTLVGRVFDAATGEPVPRFRIRAVWEDENGEVFPGVLKDSPVEDVESRDGAFRLKGLAPGTMRVFVTAPGYARHEQSGVVVPDAAESDPLLVALEPGGVLEGRVVSDRSGAPVVGAHLVVLESVEGEATGVPGLIEATSDDVGAFRLSGLGIGRPSVQVEHPDFPDTVVDGPRIDKPGERETLEIRLGKGGAIEGLALDKDGHPDRIAHARAWLMDTWGQAKKETFIDERGRFRLENLGEGTWTVEVGKPQGGMQRQRSVEVRAGQTSRVVFDPRLQGSVEGEVYLRGEPAPWAWVWLDDLDPDRRGTADSDYGFTTTDEDGWFVIDGIAGGTYELAVRIEGADSTATQRVHVPEDGSAEVRIDLGTAGVTGTVVDPVSGAGVPHATVWLYAGGAASAESAAGEPFSLSVTAAASAVTDGSGGFTMNNVTPGSYELEATASGYGAAGRRSIDVPDRGVEGLLVSLTRESFLRATVSDERKAALPDAGVYVYDAASGRLQARDLTGPDGRVEFGRLPVGDKIAVAAKDGFALSDPARVATRAGAQERVGFVLAPARDAWVAVLLEDGTPVPGVVVSVSRGGVPVRHLVFRGDWVRDDLPWVTDGEGRCHLTSLGPGRYDVRVAADGKAVEKPLTVPANGAAATLTLIVPQDS